MSEKIKEEVKKEEVKKEEVKETIAVGNYKSHKAVNVAKTISSQNKKNSDGTIARTFGTWLKPDNFYYFNDKKSIALTKEDLKNPSIRQLINNGVLYRVI